MKVSQYRDLISAVTCNLASCRSAATDRERFNEAWILLRSMKELVGADCHRKSLRDETRANQWLKAADAYLSESGMRAVLERQNAADANLCRMAYAGEWR